MTGQLTFIGNATTLLQHSGFTVLTDPNFLHKGERAYLGKAIVSRRLTEPALRIDELPPVDVVVLSHLHADHFDRRARDGLDKSLPIVTTRAAARKLRTWGFENAVALDTWQTHSLTRDDGASLAITAAPGTHAPGPLAALLPPVMGSVLTFTPTVGDPLRLYITGDTLVHDDLREVPRRHPDLDVGLWHLGGTRIPGVLGLGVMVTMDAGQGADLYELVRPRRLVPVHHSDYGVFTSPLSDFLAECDRRGLDGVRPVAPGQVIPLPPP
ncbi:MAG TPA: MBL fold metallo-hydrolase [Mycobacteriales bacterium]|nr:MBL fold metallo-hydrolase [Mycobacteriales bacterium]